MIKPEDMRAALGRYGTVPQNTAYPSGNKFYGKIISISGDYVQFQRGSPYRDRWYHRRDVTLHPL